MIRAQKEAVLAEEMQMAGLELGQPVFLRVFKEEAELEAWVRDKDTRRFAPYKRYEICKYSGGLGPKLMEGDKQAPEGFYIVGARQMNPWSQYNLSFNLGYPNDYDRAHGRNGSALMIHGGCKSIGCFAMTDDAIEEIYLMAEASIREGNEVPVHIFPFDMTVDNMARHSNSEWMPFWENLREGYELFALTGLPPKVSGQSGIYIFEQGTPGTLLASFF